MAHTEETMADIILSHHIQGLTPGVRAFADRLRNEGHTVHAPDLFDGLTFPPLDEGMTHAKSLGFGELVERSVAEANARPSDAVYIGMSMGVMPAQQLA